VSAHRNERVIAHKLARKLHNDHTPKRRMHPHARAGHGIFGVKNTQAVAARGHAVFNDEVDNECLGNGAYSDKP